MSRVFGGIHFVHAIKATVGRQESASVATRLERCRGVGDDHEEIVTRGTAGLRSTSS